MNVKLNSWMLSALLLVPTVGCGEGGDSSTDGSATDATTEGPATTDGETTDGETTDGTGETSDSEAGSDSDSESESSGDPSESESESESDGTTEGGVSFAGSIYPDIIAVSCSCHIGGGSGGLAMPDADTAYNNLVNVPSGQNPGMDRVTPGDSANSYFYHKIEGTQADAGGSGQQMPLGGGALDQGARDAIAEWIDTGAAP